MDDIRDIFREGLEAIDEIRVQLVPAAVAAVLLVVALKVIPWGTPLFHASLILALLLAVVSYLLVRRKWRNG